MLKWYGFVFFGAFAFIAARPAFAVNYPKQEGLLNDFAQILTDAEKSDLKVKLEAFEKKSNVQVIVVTLSVIDSPAQAHALLGGAWGLDGEEKKDSVLFLVTPRGWAILGYNIQPTEKGPEEIWKAVNLLLQEGKLYEAISGGVDAVIADIEKGKLK